MLLILLWNCWHHVCVPVILAKEMVVEIPISKTHVVSIGRSSANFHSSIEAWNTSDWTECGEVCSNVVRTLDEVRNLIKQRQTVQTVHFWTDPWELSFHIIHPRPVHRLHSWLLRILKSELTYYSLSSDVFHSRYVRISWNKFIEFLSASWCTRNFPHIIKFFISHFHTSSHPSFVTCMLLF